MTDILKQIEKYSTQCRSYSACTGCSSNLPNPSEFDHCIEDPMDCMERQANGMYKMKEKALSMRDMSRMKNLISGDAGQKLRETLGDEDAEIFLENTEKFCNQPNRTDDAKRWCSETLDNLNIIIREDTIAKNINDARRFLQQRKEDIDSIV